MTDIILHDIPDRMHEALCRRGEQHGHTAEQEARAMIEDALANERVLRIAEEKGLGSALRAIGEELHITTEFDNLRTPELPRYAVFD